MPRFILINENTRCARLVSRDELAGLVDVRKNPGGYGNVEACMAMATEPGADGKYHSFPLYLQAAGPHGGMMEVIHSISVEGVLDVSKSIVWRPADHVCTRRCYAERAMREIPPEQQRIIQVVNR